MKWFNTLVPFLKTVYPKRLWRLPSKKEKVLYLTFDDGPIPEVTPWALQQLEKYEAQATFFCLGKNIEKHPGILQQIKEGRHQIGNHTFDHLNGWKVNTDEYLQDVIQFEKLGHSTAYFRPPYGKCTSAQAKAILKKGYKIVMWDIISEDYDHNLSPEHCLQTVLSQAKNGSIIIFHDSLKAEKNLRKILPKVLKHYSNLGYVFKKLP